MKAIQVTREELAKLYPDPVGDFLDAMEKDLVKLHGSIISDGIIDNSPSERRVQRMLKRLRELRAQR